MDAVHEAYIKRCYELAIAAGKKGYDTFGAVLVHDGRVLAEAENTSDYERGLFGHAEFNLVHTCANRYADKILQESIFYTSCAPCERCLMSIASLGIRKIAYGVSYEAFGLLLPFDRKVPDHAAVLKQIGVTIELAGPVLEEEGMHVFEYWGGAYRPLSELIAEMDALKKKQPVS